MTRALLARGALVAALSLALSPLCARAARSGDDDRTLAPYFTVHGERGTDALPLKSVETRIDVAGVIAHVKVRQTWANEGERPLEATYVFPGSTRAAVFAMRMKVGERVLEAEIQERDQARKTFAQARDEGRTASLLEQQRPNVFTMDVTNVMPGDRIEVELDYTELLVPEEGVYELVYPQVVGPRFSHDDEEAREAWLQNPYLAAGGDGETRAFPWQWKLDVSLSAGMGIAEVGSPSHALSPRFTSKSSLALHLEQTDNDAGGDRDFVLRYRLRERAIETGLLLYRGKEEGENHFLLLVEPPKRVPLEEVPPREVIFLVDTSGSMHGYPLDTTKALFARLAKDLRPEDRFNILFFSGGSFLLAPESLRATRDNLEKAERVLSWQQGAGATQLDLALDRALSLPRHSDAVSRTFLVITDGYVSFEKRLFTKVRDRLSDANLFAFGIGTSVNRHLIEGLARAGLGEPFVVLSPDEADQEAARFARVVSRPALSSVKVRFEGFDAYDIEPGAVPDLFAERPLVVFGKYKGPASGRVVITGHTGRGRFSRAIDVDDSKEKKEHRALRYLWARERIKNLSDFHEPSDDVVKEVTALGLRYHLVTPYTSFVAVDEVARNTERDLEHVEQPLPLPQGVSARAVGSGAVYHKKTVIDLSDVTIEGELTKPEGLYLQNRKKTKPKSLIPLRDNFRAQMDAALGDAAGVVGLGTRGTGVGGLGTRGVGAGGGGYGKGSAGLSYPMLLSRSGSSLDGHVMGSADSGTIKRIIQRARAQFRQVYERALKRDPTLSGKVVIKLVIGPDGAVKEATISESTLKDARLEKELLRVLSRLKFPASPGGEDVSVSYPFVFKADG